VKKNGSTVSKDTLKGKTVGIYCSAHWCPPCRQFTPELAKFYARYKKVEPNFEIVFASSDKTEAEMKSYFTESHGDYLAFDFNAPELKKIKELVAADGIPTFAVYDAEGKLLNKNGVAKVMGGLENVEEIVANGWAPPVVGNLANGAEAAGKEINDAMSIIVRCEGCGDDVIKQIEETLTILAKEEVRSSDNDPEVIFFISKELSDIAGKLGELTGKAGSKRCKVVGDQPLLLCFNIPDNGAFYESAETEITVENVKKFIEACQSGKAKRLQLGRPDQ